MSNKKTNSEKILRVKSNPTISFDFGYGYIKAMDKDSQVSFPTFHKEYKGTKVDQKLTTDYLVKVYAHDNLIDKVGTSYAVGEFARLGNIRKEWSESQALNPKSVQIYMGTVLWVLSERNNYKAADDGKVYVNVSVGLPLDYYVTQKLPLEKMLKDFEIDIEIQNIRKKFVVDCSLVSQQGVGAFYDLVFNNDGSAKNIDELTETVSKCKCHSKDKLDFNPGKVAEHIWRFGVGISDVGYNSIDSIFVGKKNRNFVIIDEYAHSLMNQAMYKTYENAVASINRELDLDLNPFELEEAVKENDNLLKRNKNIIDATEYLKDAYKVCAQDLQSQLERNWSEKLHNLGAMIFCGGGAESIAEYFDVDVVTLIQEDSSYANTRGYLKKINKMILDLELPNEVEVKMNIKEAVEV